LSTIESMPGLAFLKAGTIEDTSWIEPTVEISIGWAQRYALRERRAVREHSRLAQSWTSALWTRYSLRSPPGDRPPWAEQGQDTGEQTRHILD
jgi:hypothetical protein